MIWYKESIFEKKINAKDFKVPSHDNTKSDYEEFGSAIVSKKHQYYSHLMKKFGDFVTAHGRWWYSKLSW